MSIRDRSITAASVSDISLTEIGKKFKKRLDKEARVRYNVGKRKKHGRKRLVLFVRTGAERGFTG